MPPTILQIPDPKPPVRSARAAQIARYFSLQPPSASSAFPNLSPQRLARLIPGPGQIVYLTGPSGSGKSRLLRQVRGASPDSRWIDLPSLFLPNRPVIDCLEGCIGDSLRLLSQVGLCEAWTYLRTPAELSDGQRWRLRLAMALDLSLRHDVRTILSCDEFAAVLDRITAQVVAHALSRLTRKHRLSVIVATSHEDLRRALRPDVVARCDFEKVRVVARAGG